MTGGLKAIFCNEETEETNILGLRQS